MDGEQFSSSSAMLQCRILCRCWEESRQAGRLRRLTETETGELPHSPQSSPSPGRDVCVCVSVGPGVGSSLCLSGIYFFLLVLGLLGFPSGCSGSSGSFGGGKLGTGKFRELWVWHWPSGVGALANAASLSLWTGRSYSRSLARNHETETGAGSGFRWSNSWTDSER